MINKLRAFLIGCCLIVVMLFFVVALPNMMVAAPIEDTTEETSEVSSAVDTKPTMYILKDYNGKIAVFEPSEDTPEQVLDVYVQNLPTMDQQMLKSGIEVDSEQELRNLIEDYDS